MRILLFGGTRFLGRHIAQNALGRGHAVTLFHRGLSNPSILPEASHVIGDRDRDLHLLEGRPFDVAIDTSGFEVREVREAARAVRQPGLLYVFVSSLSVYSDLGRMDESGPVGGEIPVENVETAKLTLESGNYGALKTACERALEEELPGSVLVIRPGLIVGPHDGDERFRYWLRRIDKGGLVLAPGDPDAAAQLIDVRDLARWIVSCAEARRTGIFNATGEPTPLRVLLETIRDTLGADARFTWVPDEVLVKHDVGAWSEMPFWLPRSLGAKPAPIDRALGMGLRLRPVADTVRDTWQWLQKGWDEDANARAHKRLRVPGGMSEEREKMLLQVSAQEAALHPK